MKLAGPLALLFATRGATYGFNAVSPQNVENMSSIRKDRLKRFPEKERPAFPFDLTLGEIRGTLPHSTESMRGPPFPAVKPGPFSPIKCPFRGYVATPTEKRLGNTNPFPDVGASKSTQLCLRKILPLNMRPGPQTKDSHRPRYRVQKGPSLCDNFEATVGGKNKLLEALKRKPIPPNNNDKSAPFGGQGTLIQKDLSVDTLRSGPRISGSQATLSMKLIRASQE